MSSSTQDLRTRVRRFLASHSKHGRTVDTVLERVKENRWNAVLFGGVLRDLMLGIRQHRARDVDIVIDGVSADELQFVFRDLVFRRNRFGGLQLVHGGLAVDVWPLHATWAFQHLGETATSFSKLPTTTFLNIEAVAVEIATAERRPGRVFSSGFFQSLERRVLELNFPENPFPALCVVRALVIAKKLEFSIGPRLADYIRYYTQQFSLQELMVAQRRHYGRLVLGERSIERCLSVFDEPAGSEGVRLPRLEPLQLELVDLDLALRDYDESELRSRGDYRCHERKCREIVVTSSLFRNL